MMLSIESISIKTGTVNVDLL